MDDALRDMLQRQLRSIKLDLSHEHPDIADFWPIVARAYDAGSVDGFRSGCSAQAASDKARFALCPRCRSCPPCGRHYRDA